MQEKPTEISTGLYPLLEWRYQACYWHRHQLQEPRVNCIPIAPEVYSARRRRRHPRGGTGADQPCTFFLYSVRHEAGSNCWSQPFRCSNGVASNEADSIDINLYDFATDQIPKDNDSAIVAIPFRLLIEFLSLAEEMQRVREANYIVGHKRVTKKRKLSSSSIEKLNTNDEENFCETEKEVAARAGKEDKDYA